jgi:tRNA nucleotidyltransferase (CCA-adding enzyme)
MNLAVSVDVPGHLPPEIQHAAQKIAAAVREAGGHAYLVGGCVRDALLGLPTKDADIEVFGLTAGELRSAIAKNFAFVEVGASFGVFKLRNLEIDVSLPRRERKEGTGHRGFLIEGDPFLPLPQAAARRDFTVNALYWDIDAGKLHDPHNGLEDLRAGVLRHTSPQFREDPLRVLRAMQQAARFDLTVAPETLALCRQIEPEDLAPERIFEEFRKFLLKGRAMRRGFDFLKESGWVRYFPELEKLIDCPQDPEWHPEGDVWTHTGYCLEAFARERIGDETEDLIVGFGVLCHDLGKPATTIFEDGHIKSPAHDVVGEEPTRSLLGRMTREHALTEAVVPLVLNHMAPVQLYKSGAGDSAIRRLARRAGRIDRLVRVVRADMQGSPPKVRDIEATDWLLERARELAVQDAAPEPLLLGRHLIEHFQLRPGRHFGPVLAEAYEAQLDGTFQTLDEALDWCARHLEAKNEATLVDRALRTFSNPAKGWADESKRSHLD